MSTKLALSEQLRWEAEAGALRELLRQFIYDPNVARDPKGFRDKVKAALAITDLGRTTASKMESMQASIDWLAGALSSAAQRQRIIAQVLRSHHFTSAETLGAAIETMMRNFEAEASLEVDILSLRGCG